MVERREPAESHVSADNEKPRDRCGLVGIYSPTPEQFLRAITLATTGVQHRGQQGAGIAIRSTQTDIIAGNGLLSEVLSENEPQQREKPALWIITHCRWATYGIHHTMNFQPCRAQSADGTEIAVAHNGEFIISPHMRRFQDRDGVSDTYLFTQMLAHTDGRSWDEKIIQALRRTTGAYSLLIGVGDTMYLARDPFGIRPLMFGKVGNKWMAASETHAFDKIGGIVQRQIRRGEIVRIDRDGPTTIQSGSAGPGFFCMFEYAYLAFPTSLIPIYEQADDDDHPERWVSNAWLRYRMGEVLAEEAPHPRGTVIVAVPDSGVHVAAGYAAKTGLNSFPHIVRDHYDPDGNKRSYMSHHRLADVPKIIRGRSSFLPDPPLWRGVRVLFIDDSIVGGYVSSQHTETARHLGAAEVHWLSSFPMIIHRCYLGADIAEGDALVGVRGNLTHPGVARDIGADSVTYISPRGYLRALTPNRPTHLPRNPQRIFHENGFCGGCVTGVYPLPSSEDAPAAEILPHLSSRDLAEVDLNRAVAP